jgi:hypothetical protein
VNVAVGGLTINKELPVERSINCETFAIWKSPLSATASVENCWGELRLPVLKSSCVVRRAIEYFETNAGACPSTGCSGASERSGYAKHDWANGVKRQSAPYRTDAFSRVPFHDDSPTDLGGPVLIAIRRRKR